MKILILALILLAFPASAEAHTKKLWVGDRAVQWQTPQTYDRNETVSVEIKFHGRSLESENVTSCLLDYYGHGIIARVNACGDGRPIRFRVANARKHAVTVKIIWG